MPSVQLPGIQEFPQYEVVESPAPLYSSDPSAIDTDYYPGGYDIESDFPPPPEDFPAHEDLPPQGRLSQPPAPHPATVSLHTVLLGQPRNPNSQIIYRASRRHNRRTLEINLVQPSLLTNGETELQRQKVTALDHTAAPGTVTWAGLWADSLRVFRHLFSGSAQRQGSWKEGPAQQPVCPGISMA